MRGLRSSIVILLLTPCAAFAQLHVRLSADVAIGFSNIFGGDYEPDRTQIWRAEGMGIDVAGIRPGVSVLLGANLEHSLSMGSKLTCIQHTTDPHAPCPPEPPTFAGKAVVAGVRYDIPHAVSLTGSIGIGRYDAAARTTYSGLSGHLARAELLLPAFHHVEIGYRFERVNWPDVEGEPMHADANVVVLRLR
jgi:hypothetical protein